MTEKQTDRLRAICHSKKRYYDANEAWMAAFAIYNNMGHEVSPYVCPHCLEYHLTSKKVIVPKFIRDLMK